MPAKQKKARNSKDSVEPIDDVGVVSDIIKKTDLPSQGDFDTPKYPHGFIYSPYLPGDGYVSLTVAVVILVIILLGIVMAAYWRLVCKPIGLTITENPPISSSGTKAVPVASHSASGASVLDTAAGTVSGSAAPATAVSGTIFQ